MPPATAGPSIAAMTGLPSASRDGPIGPRGTGPPSAGNSREVWVLALSRVAMPRMARQVRSGAERAALAPEDGNVHRLVAVESDKRFIQRLRMCGIDGVARLGARMNDREHAITALDANRHRHLLR